MNGAAVVTGLAAPETPVLLAYGGGLLVEMAPSASCVSRVAPGEAAATRLAATGRPNGVCRAADGTVWVADTDPGALLKGTLEAELSVAADHAAGAPLLFPNDLCFGPDGALYLTDSGILLEDWAPGGVLIDDWRSAKTDGRVLRVDPVTLAATCIDDDLRFVNGIAFAPDGDLYANEMLTGAVYRYRSLGDGSFGPRETHGHVTTPDPHGGFRGPDGMAFSQDGRLWVTVFGQGEVVVLGPAGDIVDRLATGGALPSNCAFGPPGDGALYVTEVEHGTLERHAVGVDGAPVHDGRKETG
jgi:gluconolactonase